MATHKIRWCDCQECAWERSSRAEFQCLGCSRYVCASCVATIDDRGVTRCDACDSEGDSR